MSRKSTVLSKKRKAINLDTKIRILDRLATGYGTTAVGRQFGINESTIRTIKKNETAIRNSVCSGTKASAKTTSYIRDVVLEKMENALVKWIKNKSQKRIPLDGITIKKTALRIYKQIKEVEPNIPSRSKQPEFSASTGWVSSFVKRHGLHNIIIKRRCRSTSETFNKETPQKCRETIENEEYQENQDSDLSESFIHSKEAETKSSTTKPQKNVNSLQVAKNRATLMFCANDSGELILKTLLVDKSLTENEMIELALKTHQNGEQRQENLPGLNADKSMTENENIEPALKTHQNGEQSQENLPGLNAAQIKEGLDLARNLVNHFEKHDHDKERAMNFKRQLNLLLEPYRELYNDLSRDQTQTLITDFFSENICLFDNEK